MKRRKSRWSKLPAELVRSIARNLEDEGDLRNLRHTCKNWRQSTATSTILPLTINSNPRKKLYFSTVSLLRPQSHHLGGDVPSTSFSPWMVSKVESTKGNIQFCDPFSKSPLLSWSIPGGTISDRFHSINLSSAYHVSLEDEEESVRRERDRFEFDKVLLLFKEGVGFPFPSEDDCGLLALYGGGRLGGYLSFKNEDDDDNGDELELPWIEIKHRGATKFDDIIVYKQKILALNRQGKLYSIDRNDMSIGATFLDTPISKAGPASGRYRGGCRRRCVTSLVGNLYLVERVSHCLLKVYRLSRIETGNKGSEDYKWAEVRTLGDKVLFVTRDYCFFVSASEFRTCCLKNCIVFSNDAFPKYGRTVWELPDPSKSGSEIFVFRLGGNSDYNFKSIASFTGFPLLLWSCPPWVWDSGSSSSQPQPQSQREEEQEQMEEEEAEEEEGEEEQEQTEEEGEEEGEGEEEEMTEYDANTEDFVFPESFEPEPEPEPMVVEQFAEAQETIAGDKMPSPITSEPDCAVPITEMPLTFAAAQVNTSRAEKPPSTVPEQAEINIDMPSTSKKLTRAEMFSTILSDFERISETASTLFTTQQGGTGTLTINGQELATENGEMDPTLFTTQQGVSGTLTINGQEPATENASRQEPLREENNVTHSVSRNYVTSKTQGNETDASTVKFQGLDIRSNFLETLQNIWSKHGNLIENSIIRNGDMVARALESLATAVLILEETSVRSLSDSQSDYLKSTLSDLQCMHFKVDWLIEYVEKAVQLQKSKPLMGCRDQLLGCLTKVVERRAKLIEELTELDTLEKELEEDVANASKLIPFSGNVDLDQPVGWGAS